MIICSQDEYVNCINDLHDKFVLYFFIDNAFVCLYNLDDSSIYLIGVNHIDYNIKFNISDFKCKYIIKYEYKSEVNNIFIDLNTYVYYNYANTLSIDDIFKKDKLFYGDECYYLIPIYIIENKILDAISYIKFNDITNDFIEYHDTINNVIHHINNSGILYNEDIIYSNMTYYNVAGRPSNVIDNMNLMAISKKNGERNKIKSRFDNGKLIQFDYVSFHMKIISDLIGYDYDYNDNIHYNLGIEYFNTDVLTDEQYEQSKKINFKILYGEHDIDNTFTNKMNKYIRQLYTSFVMDGYITTFFFKRKIYIEYIDNPTPKKLFNYFIQSFESEHNAIIMNNIIKRLQYSNTKLILYTYDSFLFDYDLNDGEDLLHDINKLISCIYNTTIKVGNDYQNLYFLN